MKILNIHSYTSGLFSASGSPNGGGEKVIIDVHHALRANGNDILTLCSPTDPNMPGMIPMLPSGGEHVWKNEWPRIRQMISKFIVDNDDAYLIIHGSDKLMRLVNDLNRPCLFIDHRSNEIHKLYHESFFLRDAIQNQQIGGKIITVSPHSIEVKQAKIDKFWPGNQFKFDGWQCFQFTTDELSSHEPCKHDGAMITIGRPEANKNPHIAEKVASLYHEPYEIVTTIGESSKDEAKEYFDLRLKHLTGVSCNLTRDETLKRLGRSMCYISTTEHESAGITAFESLCLGVPILLRSSTQSHASTMFGFTRGVEYEFFSDLRHREAHVNEFIDRCRNMSIAERQEIAMRTREKFTRENCAEGIIAWLTKIERVQGNTLDI